MSVASNPVQATRRLAGAIAAFVLFDAVWVRAPFLAALAVPFAVAAWRYRGKHRSTNVALLAWCALYVAAGISYALSNGLHSPAEAGEPRDVINAGDFVFVYLGTPASAWLGARLLRSAIRMPVTNIGGLALAALCLGAAAVAGATSAAADEGLSHYAVHVDSTSTSTLTAEESPCGTAGTVTFDQRLNAAVAATTPGLSDDSVVALLQEDPDGVLRQTTTTVTGTVVYATNGHTYTGTFTSWFAGRFLSNGMYIQTGTFSLRARSETGTLLLLTGGGHNVDGFDGTTKMFTQHGKARGCLP